MPTTLSPVIVVLYLLLVLAVQTAVDSYFTRPILPGTPRRRTIGLAIASAAGLVITVLVFHLLLPLNYAFLLGARERGTMAIAVLAVILEYFPWALPFILVRGWIVREWLMPGEIREKKQAWWSYVLVGSIVTVLLVGPLYLAVAVVQPLMTGAEEHFSQ